VGRDGERLQSFYSRLFGWETAEVAPGSHDGVMDAAAQGIGGGIGPTQKGAGHVTIFVKVDDLEGTLRNLEQLGGKRSLAPSRFQTGGPRLAGKAA